MGKVVVRVMPFCPFHTLLSSSNTLLSASHTLLSVLESSQEAEIVQIDVSKAFAVHNHQGILFKLCYVGVGDSMVSVLEQFLSNRSQYGVVDGCLRNLVNVLSREPQSSAFYSLLFLLLINLGAFS